MGLRQQALRGIKWTGVGKGLTALLQIARLSILARVLSPDDFGLMAMVMIVVVTAHVWSDLGISAALVYRQDATREERSSLYWLNILIAAAVMLGFIGLTPFVSWFFGEPRLNELMWIVSPFFLIASLGQQFQFLCRKDLLFSYMSSVDVAAAVADFAVAVCAAFLGAGVLALVFGALAGAMVRAALYLWIGMRRWRPMLRLKLGDVRRYWSFGAFQVGEKTLNNLGTQIDKIVTGKLFNSATLGQYNIAYRLAMFPLQTINPVLNEVAFPVFSKVQNDEARLRRAYLEATSLLAVLVLPLYIGMSVTADLIIFVLLGEGWEPAAVVLRILAILGCFWGIGNPIGSLLLAKGRADLGFYLNCLWLPLSLVAALIGARFGIEAIALSQLVAVAAIMFPIGFVLRWHLARIRPAEYLGAFCIQLVSALVMGATVLLIRSWVHWPGPVLEVVAAVSGGAAVYILFIALLRRSLLSQILSAFRGAFELERP